MTLREGGKALVDQLLIQGVDTLFTVPGESFLPVLDALKEESRMRLVVCRHEAAAANMAEAQARLTGRPAACFVTRGPGATHASIAVHNAAASNAPLLLLIGQVRSDYKGRQAFQEVDHEAFFAPLAKWSVEIRSTDEIPSTLARAVEAATSPTPGPVAAAFPADLLKAETAAEDEPRCPPSPPARPTSEEVQNVIGLLKRCSRPLVMVGGGTWSEDAGQELASWAERNRLPVAVTFRRQDYIDNLSPAYVGYAGVGMAPSLAERIRQADLILAIGTRLGETSTAGYTLLRPPVPRQTLVHAHPDADELGSVYTPTLAICADAVEFVDALSAAGTLLACSAPSPSSASSAPSPSPPSSATSATSAASAPSAPSTSPATSPSPASPAPSTFPASSVASISPPASASPASSPDCPWADWSTEARSDYEATLKRVDVPGDLDLWEVMSHLRERLPPHAVLTNGAGNFTLWPQRFYVFRRYRTQLGPPGGAMGYALPAAIGAKALNPQTPVVAFTGDGDFLMSGQELATAVRYDLPVIVLVFNNGMYGTIRAHQERLYPGRVSGTHLTNPDFAAYARSFGAFGAVVERTADFAEAFDAAQRSGLPAVLDLRVHPAAISPGKILKAELEEEADR